LTTHYLGVTSIGAWFGVTAATVSKWRNRYDNCPEPDAEIEQTPGWLPSRRAEWEKWHAGRPGQGAGGGRPPSKNT
jgi:hypothetical protein